MEYSQVIDGLFLNYLDVYIGEAATIRDVEKFRSFVIDETYGDIKEKYGKILNKTIDSIDLGFMRNIRILLSQDHERRHVLISWYIRYYICNLPRGHVDMNHLRLSKFLDSIEVEDHHRLRSLILVYKAIYTSTECSHTHDILEPTFFHDLVDAYERIFGVDIKTCSQSAREILLLLNIFSCEVPKIEPELIDILVAHQLV